MLFDNGVDQCQSEPGTCPWVLGGEERLEQPIHDVLVDAAALILYLQQYLVFVFLGGDGDAVAISAGVPCVTQQVDKDLNQALGVTGYHVFGSAQVNILDLRPPAVERQQVNRLVGAGRQIDRLVGVLVAAANVGEVDQ